MNKAMNCVRSGTAFESVQLNSVTVKKGDCGRQADVVNAGRPGRVLRKLVNTFIRVLMEFVSEGVSLSCIPGVVGLARHVLHVPGQPMNDSNPVLFNFWFEARSV
ncbi:hypothetical protein [Advenella sp. S44]|uniref:hypothetical protein n=1 Tax=Advenella sp. S44 TaxID=1982755 RepID=UPI0012906C77|nr:hypothetical protein [Advenella sp. S44]